MTNKYSKQIVQLNPVCVQFYECILMGKKIRCTEMIIEAQIYGETALSVNPLSFVFHPQV